MAACSEGANAKPEPGCGGFEPACEGFEPGRDGFELGCGGFEFACEEFELGRDGFELGCGGFEFACDGFELGRDGLELGCLPCRAAAAVPRCRPFGGGQVMGRANAPVIAAPTMLTAVTLPLATWLTNSL
ncbi:MAG TPA: hypothetical protein VFX20_10025 [Steroidobacteraceae bacterium]|nr:hypothetical protein [Steroidobacteraceae bacterium]